MARVKVIDRAMSLEEICFKHLTSLFPNDTIRAARLSGYVELVYELNPGLAGIGQLMEIDTIIEMPEPAEELQIIPANRLWG
jgi:phage tail protein X